MRIFFLLVDEPFYTSACLEPLLERFGASIAGAAFPAGFFDWKRLKTTFALYGPFVTAGRIARMALAAARGGIVHRQFRARRIPVQDVADANAPAFLEELRRLHVDLIVSINTPQRLKPALLALPAKGCLNVHFGMLPRYRGLLPIFHALMNGERAFGVTVHVMDEKLDNGDIVAQRAVPIAETDTLDSLYPKAFGAASQLLAEVIDATERGTLARRPNPEAEKTYYSYPSRSLVKAYRRRVRDARLKPRAPESPRSASL